MIDEHPPHGLSGRGEEVPAIVPLAVARCISLWAEQAKVRLMDEGSGLQGVARALVREPLSG
mgnify:CR=1 FL=1